MHLLIAFCTKLRALLRHPDRGVVNDNQQQRSSLFPHRWLLLILLSGSMFLLNSCADTDDPLMFNSVEEYASYLSTRDWVLILDVSEQADSIGWMEVKPYIIRIGDNPSPTSDYYPLSISINDQQVALDVHGSGESIQSIDADPLSLPQANAMDVKIMFDGETRFARRVTVPPCPSLDYTNVSSINDPISLSWHLPYNAQVQYAEVWSWDSIWSDFDSETIFLSPMARKATFPANCMDLIDLGEYMLGIYEYSLKEYGENTVMCRTSSEMGSDSRKGKVIVRKD